jgi:hypothetical protein
MASYAPYLMPIVLFFWRYINNEVYGTTGHVDSVETLKYMMATVTETITPQMLECGWTEIEYYLDSCCITRGIHV